MGLSPELWGYAENIWRRFPTEFISLGSPDLEDFFELVDGGTWCTRVVDTKSEKVIEIVLPRREVPLNTPLTPVVQERVVELESEEAYEREDVELFDELERLIGSSSARISKHVEKEVRSQLNKLEFHIEQTAELQRYYRQERPQQTSELHIGAYGAEDILSPGDSPGDSPSFAGTSPRSSVTFNLTPTRIRRREASSAPQNMVLQASQKLTNYDRLYLDHSLQQPSPELAASTEDSPSASPTSSGSTRRASMQQGVLHFHLDHDESHLAQRRNFTICHVITSGLRKKYARGEVRRAPEFDRWANGALKAENLRIHLESSSGGRVSPAEAWRNHWQNREDAYAREPRSRDETTTSPSCSPPDARLMRRTSHTSSKLSGRDLASYGSNVSANLEPQIFLWDRSSISTTEAADPDSPGGLLQQAAQRRHDQMASAARGHDALSEHRSQAFSHERSYAPAVFRHGSVALSQDFEQQGSACSSACVTPSHRIDTQMSADEPKSPAKKRTGLRAS